MSSHSSTPNYKRTSTRPVVLVLLVVLLVVVLCLTAFWAVFIKKSVTQVVIAEHTCYFTEPEFMLRWEHSVEKQWWEENYRRRSSQSRDSTQLIQSKLDDLKLDDFLLTTTYFQAFGAGTPSTEKYAKVQKKGYVGYQIDQPMPVLHWVVSRLTKGELNYGKQHIAIHLWAEDYSEVTITPERYNYLTRLTKDKCHEYPAK